MCRMYPAQSSSWMNTFLWASAPLSAQIGGWVLRKARTLLPCVLHIHHSTAPPLSERPALFPWPPPLNKRGGKGRREEKERKSTTSPLTCSALNWDPTENGISLTAVSQWQWGQRKHFSKRASFLNLWQSIQEQAAKWNRSLLSRPQKETARTKEGDNPRLAFICLIKCIVQACKIYGTGQTYEAGKGTAPDSSCFLGWKTAKQRAFFFLFFFKFSENKDNKHWEVLQM